MFFFHLFGCVGKTVFHSSTNYFILTFVSYKEYKVLFASGGQSTTFLVFNEINTAFGIWLRVIDFIVISRCSYNTTTARQKKNSEPNYIASNCENRDVVNIPKKCDLLDLFNKTYV